MSQAPATPAFHPNNPEQMHEILMRACPHTFAPHVSRGQWIPARHLVYISRRIVQAMSRGPDRPMRMIVNMPPRHGKSHLISKWLPIWYLDNFPKKKIIMCSYGGDGAMEWGRAVRDEFATNTMLFTKLRADIQSSTFWTTQEGGSMLSAGIGGPIMGKGFHLGIIDDPIKNREEADSPIVLQAHIDWFNNTFYTRREPGAHIILLMHRWSVGDLAGYLMKKHKDPWEVIKLPAVAKMGDPLGRKPGEALWPERIGLQEFSGVDSTTFDSLYQQDPPSELSTRVYHNYTDEKNLDLTGEMKLDRYDLPLMMTFDFNVNPGMHVLLGQYIRGSSDLINWRHELHGHRMKTRDALLAFEKLMGEYGGFKWPLLEVYGDRSGRSDSSSTVQTDYQQIEEFLKRMGIKYHLNVPFQNPPIKFRVDTVNDALCDLEGISHMKVHKDCVRLIDDLQNQPTDVDGLPDKSNQLLGHAGDAAGYSAVWVRPLRRIKYKPQKQIMGRK